MMKLAGGGAAATRQPGWRGDDGVDDGGDSRLVQPTLDRRQRWCCGGAVAASTLVAGAAAAGSVGVGGLPVAVDDGGTAAARQPVATLVAARQLVVKVTKPGTRGREVQAGRRSFGP